MAPSDLSISAPVNAVYYPNWKIYSTPPSSLELDHITHVYYAFAFLKPDGTLSDEHADTQIAVDGTYGGLNALRNLKLQNPGLKSLLSIGGGGKGSDPFAAIAASPDARERFAVSAKEMLDTYELDGLDGKLAAQISYASSLMSLVDWEHPDDAKKGKDYVTLLATLRDHLQAPNYLLTSALPAGTWSLQYINLGQAAKYMDYINLMAYDFTGPWGKMSGYHAQLHTPPESDVDMRTSGQSAVQYMKSKGVPANKITLGIPVYGHSFIGASNINQRFTSSGGNEGTFDYTQLPRPGTQEVVDRQAVAAYCVGGDGGLVTYDNPETVWMKGQFARQQQLAGMFYWTGAGDDRGPRSLVAAGYESLRAS
ncbi:MAG: hypothetical protein Q9224_002483 [Gallowayella concinna]